MNGVILSMVGQDTAAMRRIVEEGVGFRYVANTDAGDASEEEEPAEEVWDADMPAGRGRSAAVLGEGQGATSPSIAIAGAPIGDAKDTEPRKTSYSVFAMASSVASAASTAVYSASSAVKAASSAVTSVVGGAIGLGKPAAAPAATGETVAASNPFDDEEQPEEPPAEPDRKSVV